jgi:hypothetical protein
VIDLKQTKPRLRLIPKSLRSSFWEARSSWCFERRARISGIWICSSEKKKNKELPSSLISAVGLHGLNQFVRSVVSGHKLSSKCRESLVRRLRHVGNARKNPHPLQVHHNGLAAPNDRIVVQSLRVDIDVHDPVVSTVTLDNSVRQKTMRRFSFLPSRCTRSLAASVPLPLEAHP